MNRTTRLALGLGAWLSLAAVALTAQPAPAPPSSAPVSTAPSAARPEVRNPEQLNAGDKVHFFVDEDPVRGSGPIELLVSPLGDINFPVSRNSDILVTIHTRGKTVAQIKDELKGRLDQDYYQNATVYLKVHDQSQRRAQVLFSGEVRNNVMVFSTGETVTLFEAMVKQGYTDFANLKKVKLHRLNPVTKKTETQVIDVSAMLKGDRSKDLPLQDGDHVEVPQKTIVGF